MKKIVITGGPCGGKTSALDTVKELFSERLLVVPESATLLFHMGFPLPGDRVSSEEWYARYFPLFQDRAFELRRYLEATFASLAAAQGLSALVCDRGTLDGAAYVEGGRPEFCALNGIDEEAELRSYHAVIHLESLSTGFPDRYSRANNECRREDQSLAAAREMATRAAWKGHPRAYFIEATEDPGEKVKRVVALIQALLDDPSDGATS